MTLLLLAAALAPDYCPAALAAPEEFEIDPGHAFPTFEIKHLGIATQRGRFNKTAGTVWLDRDAGTAVVEIVIDARTIDTGNGALDAMLRGSSFFDVAKFPEIHFKTAQAPLVEGTPTDIDGDLTLLGVTKSVRLAVSNYRCTRKPFLVVLRCGVDMSTTFLRSDFGMTSMLGFVADEVKILIQAEAVHKPHETEAHEYRN